ncbi:MAG: hypothetical protein EZS28_007541 [Streblomastix strix]|uniref:B30.2/SPRY domain-containing protein n=1 Tax=Streblomastix strix TaxID=222440 RepID=A0A5J4WPP2_9EUKA|nr:MAG: hypothetical protein EZS28_007541 [Streblomastix strix]
MTEIKPQLISADTQTDSKTSSDALQEAERRVKHAEDIIQAKDVEIKRLNDILLRLRSAPVPDLEAAEEEKESEFEAPSSSEVVKLIEKSGLKRKAVTLKDQVETVVPLNKVISDGIWSLTGKYKKSNVKGFVNGFVGLAKATYQIPYPCNATQHPHSRNLLIYFGFSGDIGYKGRMTEGNSKYSDGQHITLELNMEQGTLHFFIEDAQQPVFVRGIKEPVKFFCELFNLNASFKILHLKKLSSGTARMIAGDYPVDF